MTVVAAAAARSKSKLLAPFGMISTLIFKRSETRATTALLLYLNISKDGWRAKIVEFTNERKFGLISAVL